MLVFSLQQKCFFSLHELKVPQDKNTNAVLRSFH